MQSKKILVIDDDPAIRSMMSLLLKSNGYEVILASNAEQGFQALETNHPDLVLTDYKMPGKSGIDVILYISKQHPGLPVVLMTAYDEVPLTVKAMQAGAFDYIDKSTSPGRYLEVVKRGLALSEKQQAVYESEIIIQDTDENDDGLPVGKTHEIKEIFKKVGQISLNRLNVLIIGEQGTEKEKIASLIHQSGNTREYPFFAVNCKLLSGIGIESELFGYDKDSPADHQEQKNGLFELATQGTVFIDNISYMPPDIQAKLVDALKNRRFMRIGSDRLFPLNARIVAAIDEHPKALLDEGKLLDELFALLKVNSLVLPPLRQRKDDISLLLKASIKLVNRTQNTRISKVEAGVVELLHQYDWPGNIKEFEDTVVEAAIMSRGSLLEKEHIAYALKDKLSPNKTVEKRVSLADIEKEQIQTALLNADNNLLKASQMLGVSVETLKNKIKRHKLNTF